jgi:hypothetical protein
MLFAVENGHNNLLKYATLSTTHTLPRHEPVLVARRAHDGRLVLGARNLV